jgi:3-hydroxybutyryl-CoA dehydrogenase
MRVAVVGAGLMGHAIAQLFASGGHAVAVYDPSRAARESLRERIAAILELLDIERDALERVHASERLDDTVAEADFVIEAAAEKLELKQALFADLDRLARRDAILASNTSAIPIGAIGARVAHRERLLGMHFWNPPYAVRLVEVVQAEQTAPAAVERAIALLDAIGMAPVHVRRDVPGFIGNRLQHALKREAIALVAAGVCDAATLDRVVREGFGARLAVLGPLEQSDLVGLGLTLDIHRVLMADLDRTPHAHPYLEAKVAAGELGMAAGAGFRRWTKEEADAVRARFRAFQLEQARAAVRRPR